MTFLYKVLAVLAMAALIPVGLLPAVPVLAAEPLNACANREDFRFVVTITNVSDQSDTPTPFAPGVWALSDKPGPLFVPGAHPGILFWDFDPIKTPGLEDLAEDGNPGVVAATLAEHGVKHGVFNRPVGAEGPGPLLPGTSYSFIVDAGSAPRNLTFALMFVQSNDWIIGTDEVGISLESPMGGAILGGDITDQLYLWDAGTEEDEPVGEGPNQAPRQSGANTGPEDDDNTVRLVSGLDAPAVSDLVSVSIRRAFDTVFDVTVENTSGSAMVTTPFAPGVFVVHTDPATTYMEGHPQLFKEGQPNLYNGLEALAEDGNPGPLYEFISTGGGMSDEPVAGSYGVFNTSVGTDAPGPLLPGESYHFTVRANPLAPHLSLAFMFVQSNDWFVATADNGMVLFDIDGNPMSGRVPVYLWDAGTEEDEPVGEGPNQAPRQSGANTGPEDDDNTVRLVDGMDADELVAVTITPRQARHFQVSITNVSADKPITPGVVVPHCVCDPLFTEGRPDRGHGLESLAEDGSPSGLAEVLAMQALPVQVLNTPVGADAPGPLLPGQTYQTTVFLEPAEPNLSLAFMYVLSNDLFLGSPAGGITLWDEMGNPVSGDVTSSVYLWDAGTEHNQPPGEGDSQPLMQGAPDMGDADTDNTVRLANDGYDYPAMTDLIRVVVTPIDPE